MRKNSGILKKIKSFVFYTYIVHTDMKASTALRYETGGSEACDFACCVDRVSSEVTPRVTRAGAASGLIQNDTHCE